MNDDKQPTGNPWMKSMAIWVGILVVLAAFVLIVDGRGKAPAGNTIAYSEFISKIEEGSVKEVKIGDTVIVGTLSNGDAFRTTPVRDATLTDRLSKANVTFTGQAEEQASIWLILLYQALPFVLMIGLAVFVMRQMQKNSGGGAMGFGKSRAKMLTAREGKVTFNDVAGIDEAREELQEIVDFLKDPSKFARLGGKIPKGALLVGSPGTGKTYSVDGFTRIVAS